MYIYHAKSLTELSTDVELHWPVTSTALGYAGSRKVAALGSRYAVVACWARQAPKASTPGLRVCFLNSEDNQQRNRPDHHLEHGEG